MSDSPAGLLFQPIQVGALALKNRIVMAPMTRNRADASMRPIPSTPATTPSVPRRG